MIRRILLSFLFAASVAPVVRAQINDYKGYFEKLPYANKRLILDAIRSFGSGQPLYEVFSNPDDRVAWEELESNGQWQDNFVPVGSTAFRPVPTKSSSGGKLLKLPLRRPPDGNFPDDAPYPLPGDVVWVRSSSGLFNVIMLWLGNLKLPNIKWNTSSSLLYYTYEPTQRRDGSIKIYSSYDLNTFPPRITPDLLKDLVPNASDKHDKHLRPNSKIFKGGRFLTANLSNTKNIGAYAGYYFPSETWNDGNAQYRVLRRVSSPPKARITIKILQPRFFDVVLRGPRSLREWRAAYFTPGSQWVSERQDAQWDAANWKFAALSKVAARLRGNPPDQGLLFDLYDELTGTGPRSNYVHVASAVSNFHIDYRNTTTVEINGTEYIDKATIVMSCFISRPQWSPSNAQTLKNSLREFARFRQSIVQNHEMIHFRVSRIHLDPIKSLDDSVVTLQEFKDVYEKAQKDQRDANIRFDQQTSGGDTQAGQTIFGIPLREVYLPDYTVTD